MPLKQLLKSVWLYSWVLIVPLAILASFTDLLLLGGIRLFLMEISDSINILYWTVAMLAIVALRYLMLALRVRSEERLTFRLESHLRVWWIQKVKELHPIEYHKPGTDAALKSANLAVSTMPKGCKIITQSIQALSQLLFFVPVLFWLSWQLTVVLLFIFAPIVLYLQKNFKKADNGIEEFNTYSGDYNSNIWKWVGLRKCWNNKAELSKYLTIIFDKIKNLRNASINMSVKDVTVTQNIETISITVMCVVLAICAVLIKMGTMEPFQIILFCAALIICYKPLKECSQILSNIRDLRIAYSALRKLEKMQQAKKLVVEHSEDNIKIEELSFKYGEGEPLIFDTLMHDIKLDRPLILQGDNGSGKTTMLRILSGLEIPQSGRIFMPKKEASFYMSQRLFLPPIEWLEKTIEEKNFSDTINKFFETLDLKNLLRKNGHSNGEMQRIGLAWAVVSGTPYLFLDEPFAFISQNLREPIFKAFWNATTETKQWWMMASHEALPQAYQERVVYWKL